MKFLKELNKMKQEYYQIEKNNRTRKNEHIHRVEQLRKDSTEQSARVARRNQIIRNK